MSRERHSEIPVVPASGQGRRLEVNGTWIHVEERGSREAAAEVVMLLPGSGMSWCMWAPQIPALEGDHRLLLPDLRGTGDSERRFPHNVYDARRQAADVAVVLDAYGVAAAHVVGVSQGAIVAQLLAIDHPHRVRRLVVADSYSELPTAVSAVTLRVANTVAALLPMPVLKAAALAVYRHEPLVRTTLTASWAINKHELLALKTAPFPAHTAELARITAPTLVLAGDRVIAGADEVTAARTLLDHLPDAQALVFAGAFDPVTLMRPEQVNTVLTAFLADRPLPHLPGSYTLPLKPARPCDGP